MGAFRVVVAAAESDASGREVQDEHDFVAKRWMANAPNRFQPYAPVGTLVVIVGLNFRTRCEPTYFPSGFDAVHHGHTDVENYQIEL
ncbi:MAG TPA: hypothetical protein VK937_05520 [Candidatus Limnocylindria bacterium]|nr:hypothetical protein [Candidatus Limnocylindria bacterium]